MIRTYNLLISTIVIALSACGYGCTETTTNLNEAQGRADALRCDPIIQTCTNGDGGTDDGGSDPSPQTVTMTIRVVNQSGANRWFNLSGTAWVYGLAPHGTLSVTDAFMGVTTPASVTQYSLTGAPGDRFDFNVKAWRDSAHPEISSGRGYGATLNANMTCVVSLTDVIDPNAVSITCN